MLARHFVRNSEHLFGCSLQCSPTLTESNAVKTSWCRAVQAPLVVSCLPWAYFLVAGRWTSNQRLVPHLAAYSQTRAFTVNSTIADTSTRVSGLHAPKCSIHAGALQCCLSKRSIVRCKVCMQVIACGCSLTSGLQLHPLTEARHTTVHTTWTLLVGSRLCSNKCMPRKAQSQLAQPAWLTRSMSCRSAS